MILSQDVTDLIRVVRGSSPVTALDRFFLDLCATQIRIYQRDCPHTAPPVGRFLRPWKGKRQGWTVWCPVCRRVL